MLRNAVDRSTTSQYWLAGSDWRYRRITELSTVIGQQHRRMKFRRDLTGREKQQAH